MKKFILASISVAASFVWAEGPALFHGRWITDRIMAGLTPKPVYARQLQSHLLPKPDKACQNAHILFRKAFEAKAAQHAVVRISADDYYKLYLNGVFVGQGPAAGMVEHTYFNEIDVTPYLKPGRNVLAVHTYYQGLVNRVWVSGDNRHGLILDLVADGETIVRSDESFLTKRHSAFSALGEVGYSTQFMERYDAAAKEVGFERPDFDDSDWQKATVHPLGRDYSLYLQPTPMLAFESIAPIRCERLENGGLRLDFGGIYVGSLALSAEGPKGSEIVMRFGQELLNDGTVRYRLRANCTYEEKFALSGRGVDRLNQFDYKSFRYVELLPPNGVKIDAASARLIARHAPFALRAKPAFADSRLKGVWELCVNTFRYGVQEQIQDCMEREKGYYLGDGCYTMLTNCRLTQDWSGARRFIDDFLRTARIDRGLVTCANCSFMQEIAEYPLMFVWFVKAYIEETGDIAFVRDRYAVLVDLMNCYRERYARADGLLVNLDKWCVVEWPKNFQDGYDADVREGKVCRDMHNAVNAWYLGAVASMNEIAAKIGEKPYRQLKPLKDAFAAVFYDSARHLFVDREGSRHVSLPGNVYATFFGLEPDGDRAAHHRAFVSLVREKGYSSISLFQFFPLFSWLRANGEQALFNELVLSNDGWLRMLREGATRTFEGWGRDTKWNTSLFHLTTASLAYFLCDAEPACYVDPTVGCADNGHCFAAATCPFSLVQAGPDTGNTWWDYCSGFRYRDTKILGFSQTHMSGTGCGDLGDVLVMPFTGDVDLARTNFASAYRKETFTTSPGTCAVTLDDNHARVEIAAAPHSAIYRIDYLDGKAARLLVDFQYGLLNWGDKTGLDRVLSADIRREGDSRVVGTLMTKMWVKRTYHFVLEFDRPIATWQQLPRRNPREKGPRLVLGFAPNEKGTLRMKFAISANSIDGARRNLAAEIPAWDIIAVKSLARRQWNELLSRATVEGSPAEKKNFYTSLYHLFIQPNDLADVGDKPRYSTFSCWDTFRAAHPLYTLIAPERVDGFVNSMLGDYRRHGFLPIWTLWGEDNQCMIGTHSIPVIVDAYLKGFRGFDATAAYAAIKDTLTRKHNGRGFERWDLLEKFGYYPFDKVACESVSRTLEAAYDDWCAARMASKLGKADDATYFDRRAHNWTNLFDRSTCLARGRDSAGNWRTPFNPFKLNVGGNGIGAKDFTEGNSWQYSWHVMQHPEELVALHGGPEAFARHLDTLFSLPEKAEGMGFALDATGLIGQYAHGNEPSHHTTYFYQYALRGDRTAELVREVCDKFYRPEPEGLCGNDDCGQMSAWYLFSAMGFYPFNPCGGDYVIGAPQVPKVTLSLPDGKSLRIVAKGLSRENKYVKSVTLNGKPVRGFILRHADLVRGGELVFEMGLRR